MASNDQPGGSPWPDWARGWASSVRSIHQLFTVVRLPPWEIKDIAEHYKINVASLAILFVLFLIIRHGTSYASSGDLMSLGALYLFALFSLFVIGVVVRYYRNDEHEAVKLTNRWSTFFIVAFAYCLMLLGIILLVQMMYLRLGGNNLLLAFNEMFEAGWAGLLILSGLIAAIAVAILWTRTRRDFPDFRDRPITIQSAILVLTTAMVGFVFFVATFAVG